MHLDDIKHEIVMKNGQKYEVIALVEPMDLTEQNNGIKTEVTHLLKGFDEDLYVIIETEGEEGAFYFGYKVGDTGLIVNIEDEQVYEKAFSIFMEVADR